jgi:hypothetical protein
LKTLTEFSSVLINQAREVLGEPTLTEAELEAQKTAIETKLGIAGDRVERLIEVIKNAGDKLKNARLVRVFQGEKAPPGSISVGEFHYVIDRAAAPKPQRSGRGDKRGDRRGGGERRGGGGFGGGGFGGGGPGGARGKGPGKGGPAFERVRPGEVPKGGYGWTLTREPGGDDRKRGGKRPPRGRKPGGDRPRDDRGRGPRPQRPPRPPRDTQPDATQVDAEGQIGTSPADTQKTPTMSPDKRERQPRPPRGRGRRGQGPGPVVEKALPRHKGQVPPPKQSSGPDTMPAADPGAPTDISPPPQPSIRESEAPEAVNEGQDSVSRSWRLPEE